MLPWESPVKTSFIVTALVLQPLACSTDLPSTRGAAALPAHSPSVAAQTTTSAVANSVTTVEPPVVDSTPAKPSRVAEFEKVQEYINREYNNQNYGIFVMSLTDESTAQVNGNTRFVAASTGKLPVLYYTQKRILEGAVDGDQLHRYSDAINQIPHAYMRGGAGILQNQHKGSRFSLHTIMTWTAKYSDNQGANFLAHFAANNYDKAMKKEISEILEREWITTSPVTAKDNAMLLRAIYHQGGKLITDLSNTIFDKQRIPKYLPVQVAHKIGDLEDLRHDAAIVYAKDPYILSVLTRNYQSYERISILSKNIFDILHRE